MKCAIARKRKMEAGVRVDEEQKDDDEVLRSEEEKGCVAKMESMEKLERIRNRMRKLNVVEKRK